MPDDASPYAYQFVSGDDPDSPPVQKSNTVSMECWLPPGFYKPQYGATISSVVSFQLDMKLWKWTPYIRPPDVPGKPQKYFSVSTQDSRVLKPTLVVEGVQVSEECFKDTNGYKVMFGPYIESVTVEMWFDLPRTVLKQYAPSTDIEHGSESQSYGINFGFNGGFFGDAPTAGASFGFSYTTSHSISLTDFELQCSSDNSNNKSQQVLSLAMKGDGSRYEGVDSLDWTFPPHTLPARAFGDIPFTYDGLWELPGDSNDTIDFHIRVTTVCPVRTGYGYHVTLGSDHEVADEQERFVKPAFVWDRIVPVPLGVSFERPKNGHTVRLPLR